MTSTMIENNNNNNNITYECNVLRYTNNQKLKILVIL